MITNIQKKKKGFSWGNVLKCVVAVVAVVVVVTLGVGGALLAGAAVGATAAIGLSPSKGGEKGNNKSVEDYIKESVNRVLVGALLGTIGTHSRGKSTTVLSWIGDKVKNTFNAGVSAIGNVAHNYVSTNDNRIDNCQKFIDEKLNECIDFINSKVDSGFETIESKFGINKEQKVYSALKDTIREKIGFQEGLVKETEDMVVGIPSMLEKYSPSMQIARLVDKTVDAYKDPEKYINGAKGLYEKASYVASHPKETMDAIGNKIEKYFKEVDKDPYKRGMLEGRATIFAASMFVGSGEAKVASKVEKEAEALKVASKGKNIVIETEFETQKAKVYARIAESRKGREVSTYSEFLKKEKAIIGQIEIKARVNASVIESRKGTKVSRYQEFLKEEKKIIDNLKKTEGAADAGEVAIKITSHIESIGKIKNLSNILSEAKSAIGNLRNMILDGEIVKLTGGKIDAKVVTVAIDDTTGNIYYGISGFKQNPTRNSITNKLLDTLIKEAGEPLMNYSWDNCGEFNAINNALNKGVNIKNLSTYSIEIKSGEFWAPCKNCSKLYEGLVKFIGE